MKSGITNASCRRKISYQSEQDQRQKKRDKKAKEKNGKKAQRSSARWSLVSMIRGLSTSNGGLRRPRPRPLRTRLNAVRKGKEKNVVCTKTVVAKVEHVEKVRMLCKEYQERMKGNSSETHQGVVTFECTEDTFEENAFHFWERYKDANSFNQNMTSEDTSYFLEKVGIRKPRARVLTLLRSNDASWVQFGSVQLY